MMNRQIPVLLLTKFEVCSVNYWPIFFITFQFIAQAQSLHVINLSGKKMLHVKFPYDLSH